MSIKSTLETSPAINAAAIKSYIVSLWSAAAKYESWNRAITILSALEVVTDGELSDEIALLVWMAFEREDMAAREVSQ